MTIRRAVVAGHKTKDDLEAVRRYLPANYEAYLIEGDEVRIVGTDNAGWTLDGYVIPRLGSGLRFAKEVIE